MQISRKLSAFAAIVLGAITADAAHATIISIKTGVAVIGNFASNLMANGSFGSRALCDPVVTTPVYWSGVTQCGQTRLIIAKEPKSMGFGLNDTRKPLAPT
jgi:hypothetical protein